jgi:hypothetical protein
MVAEFNPAADSEYIPPLNSDSTELDQAGRTAMVRLGSSKGYATCIDTSVNVIMVHRKCFGQAEKPVQQIEPRNEKPKVSILNPHGICMDVSPEPHTSLKKAAKTRISAKIVAVMSAPRLGFVNNLMIAARTLVPLGIQIEVGYGVFWSQILSRIIEEQIAKGIEWIVTLDYDSYYLKDHFLAILQLMAEYPEVDAIMPIQVKREEDTLLAGVNDAAKANCEYEANVDLIEVDRGHFGLTCFRLASFAKLKKPWFVAVPNENGDWGEGRLDDDMYFWKNWRESGLKLCLAPKVSIGHMQLMITWPGVLEIGSKPYHQYLSNVDKEGIPEWCKVPKDCIPKQIKE